MNWFDSNRLDRIQERIERGYLRLFTRRGTILALTGIFCLAALAGWPKLKVNNTTEVWFSEGTPSYARYQTFTEKFGADEYLFVALDLGDVFTPKNLATLDRLSREFERLPGVVEVMDLPSSSDVWWETGPADESGIFVRDLRERFALEPPADLRRRILADERFVGTLVSPDGRVAVHLIRFENPKVGTQRVTDVKNLLHAAGVPFHLGGYIFAQREMDRLTFRDYFLFGAICLVILSFTFWAIFKSAALTFLFIGDCVLTVAVVLGAMGHAGVPIHLMTGILPPLLMAMAIADDLHLVERFQKNSRIADPFLRVARSTAEVAIPSFLSGLTTFAGFVSLSGGAVPAIGHFGTWSGFGILFTYAFSFLTVPLMLTYTPFQRVSIPSAAPGVSPASFTIARFCGKHRTKILIAFAALCLLAANGIQKIVVDTQLTNFFKADSDFMRSMDFIEQRFGNTGPVEIVLTSPVTDGLKSPEILRTTERLIERLKAIPNVETVLSIHPVLKTMTRALYEGKPEDYRLPGRKDLLEQELLLLSLSPSGEETVNRFATPAWTEFRIQIRLPRMTNNEALALLDRMEELTREVCGKEQAFYLTGVVECYARLDRFILETQLKSFCITLAVVALVFWLQFGRPLWTVLALLPNVFPIVLMFATMGWCGITLNVATATIASITLGLADDDTIYFFYAYLRRRTAGQSAEEAMPGTMAECGRALWLATLLNVVGFSIFVFSSFRPTTYFGALTSEVWVLALAAEFLFLPSLLFWLDRKSYARPAGVSQGRGV